MLKRYKSRPNSIRIFSLTKLRRTNLAIQKKSVSICSFLIFIQRPLNSLYRLQVKEIILTTSFFPFTVEFFSSYINQKEIPTITLIDLRRAGQNTQSHCLLPNGALVEVNGECPFQDCLIFLDLNQEERYVTFSPSLVL